jgi:protein-disulfide isomerase
MTKANFRQAAEVVGIDVDAFGECIDDGRYNNTVQLNSIAAAETGVNSTPTFFINGKVLPGNQPLPAFQQEINAILGAADAN